MAVLGGARLGCRWEGAALLDRALQLVMRLDDGVVEKAGRGCGRFEPDAGAGRTG
jgi:hypothetical protein